MTTTERGVYFRVWSHALIGRLLREPLLQFLALGGHAFAL